MKKYLSLALWIIVFEAVSYTIGMATQNGVDGWYASLTPPPLTPPNIAFHLDCCDGCSGARVHCQSMEELTSRCVSDDPADTLDYLRGLSEWRVLDTQLGAFIGDFAYNCSYTAAVFKI